MGKKTFGIDVKPQFLRGQVVESAANTYTEATIPTPNMTEAGYVMEILKIFWEIEGAMAIVDGDGVSIGLMESSHAAMPFINDAGVIMKYEIGYQFTTSGHFILMNDGVVDYTDGAGNGLLSARKNLILAVEGASQASAQIINVAILYRLVKVSPAEIIGLIST